MKRNPYFLCAMFLLLVTFVGSFFLRGALSWSIGLLYIGYDTFLLAFVGSSVARVLRRAAVPLAAPVSPESAIAILVPARNESAMLGQFLQAILPQLGSRDSVYWIDDGSTDDTLTKLRRDWQLVAGDGHEISRREPRLRVWAKPHTGKADSLNRVWPKLNSEIMVTLDADTLPEPGALACIRQTFEANPRLVAAGGTLVPVCQTRSLLGRLMEGFQRFEYVRAFLARRAWMEVDALLLVSGAFAAYRTSAIAEVGGFSTTSLVEDYELVHRLHRFRFEKGREWEVQVLVGARATTDSPHHLGAFLRQRRRWFAGFLQTHFADADMVGNRRYGNVGRLILPIKSIDTLQPVYGVASLGLLILIFACGKSLHPVLLAIIFSKLALDLFFHFWSIRLYGRWQQVPIPARTWAAAILITLAEPFTFQLLRHIGAVWGWLSVLRRKDDWIPVSLPAPAT